MDSSTRLEASGHHHRDGRADDAVWPVRVLLNVQGHLSSRQHPRGQSGLVLPGHVGARDRKRIVNITERATSQTVTGVDHIESNSFAGIGLVKIYFKESASTALAISQLSSVANAMIRVDQLSIDPSRGTHVRTFLL